jgi:hypothetical protein
MHLELFDYALWFGTPLVQAGILFVMYRRKLSSLYPRFVAYTVLQAVSVPVLAALFYRSYEFYYYAYYVNLGLSIIAVFAVLYETSLGAMERDEPSLWALKIAWTVVVLCGSMVLLNLVRGPHLHDGALTDTLMFIDRSEHVLQIALVLGFILFSHSLSISSRSFVFGVALGFGFFAVINMLVATAISHHGTLSSSALSRVNGVAYLIATLIWLAYSGFGSDHPSGLDYSQLASPTQREFGKWIERNFKHPQMSAMRARNLI